MTKTEITIDLIKLSTYVLKFTAVTKIGSGNWDWNFTIGLLVTYTKAKTKETFHKKSNVTVIT